jgi:hypothetical protein
MDPGRRTSATAVALGHVIEWSPPRTIGIAPVAATSRTLRWMSAWARSIQAGTMFASPASTTVSTSNGSLCSWSEWIEPDVYCASRIARGPKRAPGRWLTASSNGAPTIATSTFRARSSAGSSIHGRFMNVVGPT